ncbi:tagatose-6-phosphate kinase [Micromonospora fluostatini]|uniref:Tagatose-6-phosphate kinase n=1 Tax=Micromonospora fluostatini TaxID=1629071 RepID=A0ABY2DKP9_9ACTN|nr:tagatose-6-phosphate kinase [Micromonospora fluostatini]
MSKNAVDACIAVAHRRRQPLMLIPSRRQVEAAAQGGGYVEGWNTETFAAYVRRHDPEGLILLCRDHGGPYQNPRERAERLSGEAAMISAMASFREDVQQGFDLLHIDTSMDLDGVADVQVAIDRAVELYGECAEAAAQAGRSPMYEIGFEDQGRDTNDPFEFRDQLDAMLAALARHGLPRPTFVVAQTATKVVETDNVGAFSAAPSAVTYTVSALAGLTADRGIALKAHNCDYLTGAEVRALSGAGVDALNVAPEFGVVETRAFLRLLDRLGLTAQRDAFLAEAYASGLWRKWMAPDTAATDTDRAVIAGHYVYGSATFAEIKEVAAKAAIREGIDVDTYLRDAVAEAIERYAAALPHPVPSPLAVAGN